MEPPPSRRCAPIHLPLNRAPRWGRIFAIDVRKPPADRSDPRYILPMTQYTLFETEIGWAGLAWNDKGLVGVHLPERDPDNSRRSFERRFPGIIEAPAPETFAPTIAGIQALMRGEKVDLSDVPP